MTKSSKNREEELRIAQSKPVHLTEEGFTKLKEKLAHLKKILPDLSKEVERTAGYGDRSENFEYQDAKRKLRQTQSQILFTEAQIRRAKIIPQGVGEDGKIQLGSTVLVESKEGKKLKFRIVGPNEADPDEGFISFASPLGVALMNREKGERVKFEIGNSVREYKIIEIL